MERRLRTCPETLALLEASGVDVVIDETTAAVQAYNELAQDRPVDCLIHSNC